MNNNGKSICLDGIWRLYYEENNRCAKTAPLINDISALEKSGFKSIRGSVPGNFELDMQAAGLLPDLFFGKNALMAQELENMHLWYATEFEAEDTAGEWFLDFEGIDTVAEIYLNGEEIAYTDNMMIAHEFMAEGLRVGKNELIVHIIPAVIAARNNTIGAGVLSYLPYNAEAVTIRKPAHMFGWDIMPRIVSGGIWRSVFLFKKSSDRIEDIYISPVKADSECGIFHFYYKINISQDFIKDYRLVVTGACRDSRFRQEVNLWHTEGVGNIKIDNPYLWWPKGMGEPNLYKIEVMLYNKDTLCDTFTVNAGVRKVRLERTDVIEDDGSGEFCFYVNGERMFVRGTNWVPLDAFHSRDKQRLPKALELLDDTNCNMVRCWGGNVYEDNEFFDFCDKHGIAVWQDFSMACGYYPQSDEFAEALRQEATSVVCKLRNHPSIFMWAGDNECDEVMATWNPFKSTDPNKNILTRRVLPEVIRNNDPFREYLPSSPYFSPRVYNEGKSTPEQHLWGPRQYFKSDYYRKANCRFASETGYHGCPSVESISRFISSEKLWPWQDNDEWFVHAACMEIKKCGMPNSGRIPLMATQIMEFFGEEMDNLADYSQASQLCQAEALKYFIERFRLGKWDKTTGILWWNLIDGWPQFSDAIVDYYYNKKIAYDVVVNSQRTVCLMMREPQDGRLTLAVSNDSLVDAKLTYKVITADDRVLLSGSALAPANLTVDINTLDCDTEKTEFYIIEWEIDGKKYKNHYLCGNAPVSRKVCVEGYRKLGLLKGV